MTQNELMVAPQREAWVELLKPAGELARVISNTEFVPKDLRGRDAAIVACILTAHELNVQPMTALSNIAIIDGRPALSATLMRALVLSRGHEIWFEETISTKVTAGGRRRDSDQVTRVTWTSEMARNAGLLGRQNWTKYPRAMLEARASAELCRLIFADCLAGLVVAIEELQDGEIAATSEQPTTSSGSNRRRRPAVASTVADATPTEPEQPPPLPGEQENASPQTGPAPAASTQQAGSAPTQSPATKKLMAVFHEVQIDDRDDRLAVCSLIVNREIESSKDLTAPELDAVLNTLEDWKAGKLWLNKANGAWMIERAQPAAQPE